MESNTIGVNKIPQNIFLNVDESSEKQKLIFDEIKLRR